MSKGIDPTNINGPRTAAGATSLGDSKVGYTLFNAVGHQTMAGAAQPWDDLRIEPMARTTGANAPTFEMWIQDALGTTRGVYLYSFTDAVAGSEKEIFFSMQMPHTWAGTAIYLHVHWIGTPADTTVTGAAPLWTLEYTWADIGTEYPATVYAYTEAGKNYTSDTAYDTTVTLFKHYISKFGAITPSASQNDISSVLIGRLFRDSAHGSDTYDAPANKCGLLYIDAHYQLARIGSDEEYTA